MGTMLGRRAYTTIDRSKPNAALALATGAEYVQDTKIPLQDRLRRRRRRPVPGQLPLLPGRRRPARPLRHGHGHIYGYNTGCSVPGSAGKTTTFTCTADYGQVADGSVWACVIAADASIPDNPNGPDQSAGAEKANLSAPSCDGVVVDRTPPTAAIQTGSASVKVGDLVSFTASASDATSGLAGTAGWTWGDNTAAGSGDAATHTYTHAGTYEVALSVADAAGNTAVAKKTITVAPAGNGTPDDETSGGGTSGGGTRRRTTPPAGGRRPHDAARRRASRAPTRPRSSSPPRAASALARRRSRSSSPRATPAASSSRSPAASACSPAPPSGSTRTAPPTTA